MRNFNNHKRKLENTNKLEQELRENQEKFILTSSKLEEKEHLLSKQSKSTDLVSIFSLIENSLTTESEWDEFKLKIKELSPNFLHQLLENHPSLTKSEIRLLILIKTGYTQKEIATILNIAPDSVKKAKSRVRKKIGLTDSVTLNQHLLGIEDKQHLMR
jgi:DNA-binding CsgD family transcriptional regulator